MPTRHLPANPSLDHLKYQARDLLKLHASHDMRVLQHLREFLPRLQGKSDEEISAATLKLSDAQLAVARGYGFASWTRLKKHIEAPKPEDLDLPHQERIKDPVFRRAVDLLDAGDVQGLRAHLNDHPGLVSQRVLFEGGNYFQNPTLLEFVAENPIRHGTLPSNIVEVARVILDAGGKEIPASVQYTLGLVCSGCVPRECGVQIPLIDLLCDYGADPNRAMSPALGHGEFSAVEALLRRGARLDLPTAASLGLFSDAKDLIPSSSADERHRGLALASIFGHEEIVRELLEAGEDPNRYNPEGCHSHSTPLHQAALAGHLGVVKLLVAHGARLDIKDMLFDGTPLGWAKYANQMEVAEYLKGLAKT